VRIGAHWGRLRRRGDDIIGRDVNLASRLTTLAGPGEIVCSGDLVEAARQAVAPESVRFVALGPAFVKGIEHPVRTFLLDAAEGTTLADPARR
jgi:class 3 adenylate cyclase